jgi:hypothetical protein
MQTAYTFSNSTKPATLVDSLIADDGTKIEVVKQAGVFFIKRNGAQVGGAYGSEAAALLKAQAAAYFGESL